MISISLLIAFLEREKLRDNENGSEGGERVRVSGERKRKTVNFIGITR